MLACAMMCECDPVGLVDIAERLGVTSGTARMWSQRNVLPEPRWRISGRPAWNWAEVWQWAQETGRTEPPRGPRYQAWITRLQTPN